MVTAQDAQLHRLEYVYLDLPELPSHPKKGGSVVGTAGTPRIVRVSDTTVTYRFPDGSTETKRIKTLVKPDKHPTFPG